MSHLIYLVIIAFLVFVIVKLALRNMGFKKDLDALEEGMTEVTDAYESDSLSWMETDAKNLERIEMAEAHASYMSDFVERKDEQIEELRGELVIKNALILGLQYALSDAQEKHEKCLPVLDWS